MNTKSVLFFIVVYFSMVLVSSAVFAAEPEFKNDQTCLAQGKTDKLSNQRTPPSAIQDPEVARWEKMRALYLHDLQMSSLDQKSGLLSEKDYNMVSKLIEAALYTAYAKADQVILDEPKTARNDLDQALTNFDNASTLASDSEKSEIATIKKLLVATRDTMIGCHGQDSQNEDQAYNALKHKIDHLINGSV